MPTDIEAKKCNMPTEAQYRFVEWYAAGGLVVTDDFDIRHVTLTQLARELGVSRMTLYRWRESIPDFNDHVDGFKRGIMQEKVSLVWRGVFLRAAKGDVKQAEMFLSTFDSHFVPAYKKEVITATGLTDVLQLMRQRKQQTN